MNPFLYSKSRHRRTHNPPVYSYYASYKPILREEFGFQCVYCRLPDGMKGRDSFGVDHYRPKKKFPDLETTYSNLFYACNCCNRRKGDFWPTAEEALAGRFIPNPCDHAMFEHLRYRSAHVDPRTPAGKQAESKLMLNDKDSVEYREMVLGLMILTEEKIGVLRETIVRIEMKALKEPEQAEGLEKEKEAVEDELKNLERYLSKITGGG